MDCFPFSDPPAALYKGDSRTRTLDISVDGVVMMAWTSSGETAGFETVDLGVQGKVIDLHGVLADSDWLSISEVGAAEDCFASVVCTAHGGFPDSASGRLAIGLNSAL